MSGQTEDEAGGEVGEVVPKLSAKAAKVAAGKYIRPCAMRKRDDYKRRQKKKARPQRKLAKARIAAAAAVAAES